MPRPDEPPTFSRFDVAAIRELVENYIPDDKGPRHESWKSDELLHLIARVTDIADRLDKLIAHHAASVR